MQEKKEQTWTTIKVGELEEADRIIVRSKTKEIQHNERT